MPRRNAKREALIAEVRKARGSASDKSYRLRKLNIDISGIDPRKSVDARHLSSLSTNELRSHLNELRSYTDRSNQFVAGLNRTPIARSIFNEYKAEEAKFNNRGSAIESRLFNVKLPGQDLTVGGLLKQRREGKTEDNITRVYVPINRQAFQMESADSVKALIADLKNKNRPDYLQSVLKPRANSLYALLRNSGNADFIPMLDAMTEDQLHILIDYSKFGSIAKERFSSGDNSIVDKEDTAYFARYGVSREDDIRDELQAQFEWVLEHAVSDSATNTPTTLRGGTRRSGDSTVGNSRVADSRGPKRKGRK